MRTLAVVLLAFLCVVAQAQQTGGTSPNLIGSNNLTGTVDTTSNGGGYSGGYTPGYNSSTNTIMFGYTQSSVAYTYAFSQALRDSGMTITGYNYSWQYYNQGDYSGNLSATANFAGTNGLSLHNKSWVLGTTSDWTTHSGTESFVSGILASNIANFSLTFSGKDSRYWAGYYGPQVRNASMSLNYTFDVCSSDPLSSPSCPGYAAAYMNQQCTANPLYNSACPGYATAYFTQQCTANPLYDQACPGYAAAYLSYQCSVNPLYATTCPGYEQAYFNQQCTENALYSTRCSGYEQAYLKQQCSVNPLYATTCSGYAAAYFDQQCRLNGLYDKRCPNYSTAYATKMLLEQQGTASIVATAGVVAATAPATDSSGEVKVSVVKDENVNAVLTTTATSASPAQAATATVPLAPQPAAPSEMKQQPMEKKPEGGQPPLQGQGPQGGDKPSGPTARQQLAERKAEAAKREAVDKGKNLANEMGKAASMEAQKEIQNVVIQAMGFTPGFDAYGKTFVPDVIGYKPFTVYNNQINVDNRRLGWGLYGPSDKLHNDLVNSQYKD